MTTPAESHFELANVLESMNRGRTSKEIDDSLRELLAAVSEQGRAGSLTIQLSVVPTKRQVTEVTAKITLKLPKESPEKAIFFINDRNELVRDDPRQQPLPFPTTIKREDVPQAAEAHNA
jgi:hypothetical protein